MKKIVLLPLDDRPCTYNYPLMLANIAKNIDTCIIDHSLMGYKKQGAKYEDVANYLLSSCKDANYLVCALDTLIYGSILASRLHYENLETLTDRLNLIKKLKQINPQLKIFAYHLIMRCPSSSGSDEEPNYYSFCGEQIHNYGKYLHLSEIRKLSAEEEVDYQKIKDYMLKNDYMKYLDDYLYRRNLNTDMNIKSINLVKEGLIDFLIIPQDDSAPYGFTAKDQIKVRNHISQNNLDLKVYMYPDADAVTNTLLARAINEIEQAKPNIFVRYSSSTNGNLIPRYEDRNVSESIKYQILAAGGRVVYDMQSSDIVCMVNVPSSDMQEAVFQNQNFLQYQVNRNLIEYVEYIDYLVSINKPVIVADIAYANGGDIELVKILKEKGLLYKVTSYAGWNTSANTLGTCIPHAMIVNLFSKNAHHYDFLALRYLEDVGYMSIVRNKILLEIKKEGFDWYCLDGQRGPISQRIKNYLEIYKKEIAEDENHEVSILDNYQPWNRMFETALIVKLTQK